MRDEDGSGLVRSEEWEKHLPLLAWILLLLEQPPLMLTLASATAALPLVSLRSSDWWKAEKVLSDRPMPSPRDGSDRDNAADITDPPSRRGLSLTPAVTPTAGFSPFSMLLFVLGLAPPFHHIPQMLSDLRGSNAKRTSARVPGHNASQLNIPA